MSTFKPFHPDHEILGMNMLDITSAINSENFLPIWEKYGLTQVEPEKWYPVQIILDTLSEVAHSSGAMLDLVSIGLHATEVAYFPPEYLSKPLNQALPLLPHLYRMNHRGTNIGEVLQSQISENHYRYELCLPFPDDLWYGIIYGFVRNHVPKNHRFSISYAPDIPRRDHGGEVTIIDIFID